MVLLHANMYNNAYTTNVEVVIVLRGVSGIVLSALGSLPTSGNIDIKYNRDGMYVIFVLMLQSVCQVNVLACIAKWSPKAASLSSYRNTHKPRNPKGQI